MTTSLQTAVFGDGVITIPIPICSGDNEMSVTSIDLPPNVATQLQLEAMQRSGAINAQNMSISQMAAGVLQAAMAKMFDKIGSEEARAISGLNNTPIGAPSGNKAQG